jgi:integrase
MSLTQRIIDATPLPKTGFTELRDHGLVMRIYPTGKRTYSFEYRSPVTGKNARSTFDATSLADARTAVLKHKLMIREGRDPNLERKAAATSLRIETARTKDVRAAIQLYEADFLRGAKEVSRRERMAKLRRAVEPFNNDPVASLTKGELVTRLDVIEKENGPVARNRAQAEIRAWLGWLHERELVQAVVLVGVKKRGVEKTRTRVLTDAELGAIARVTTDRTPYSDIVRVLLHTGMRKGEVANLQPRDLDFEARTIRVREEVAKTSERVIPMIDAIAAMLAERAEGQRDEAYIFGNGSGFRSPFSGWGNGTDRLRGVAGEGWTLHDIRRTVATRLYEAGVDSLVVEDLLGHTSGVRNGIAGVYNRAVTLNKQRDALNSWAAKLTTLMGANITPLRQSA